MRKTAAGLLVRLGMAGRWPQPGPARSPGLTGRFLQAPAIGLIITAEGTWTFGSTTRASGDYPLLLNGSTANGGWAASLQVTNGNLYAFAKSGAHYRIRFNGA
jgi:hypothetical protein